MTSQTPDTGDHADADIDTDTNTAVAPLPLPTPPPRLARKRAVLAFLIAYIAVTVLGAALSVILGVILHSPDTTDPMQNRAYVISERFDPLINLAVWTYCARWYFRRANLRGADVRHALHLSTLWICLALPVDFVGFVLIKNPISLTPHQFYVGQFPWIYLIYLAVFAAPLCAAALDRKHASPGWRTN